jgi:hypothetical protein
MQSNLVGPEYLREVAIGIGGRYKTEAIQTNTW